MDVMEDATELKLLLKHCGKITNPSNCCYFYKVVGCSQSRTDLKLFMYGDSFLKYDVTQEGYGGLVKLKLCSFCKQLAVNELP